MFTPNVSWCSPRKVLPHFLMSMHSYWTVIVECLLLVISKFRRDIILLWLCLTLGRTELFTKSSLLGLFLRTQEMSQNQQERVKVTQTWELLSSDFSIKGFLSEAMWNLSWFLSLPGLTSVLTLSWYTFFSFSCLYLRTMIQTCL